MPRGPKPSSSAPGTRRSNRLNGRQATREAGFSLENVPKTKRRKLLKAEAKHAEISITCSSDPTPMAKLCATSSKDLRRSQRITPTELIRREKVLMAKEQECKRKSDELNERILLLSKREDEATLMLSQMAEREAQAALSQLEEHFTCPLPGHCGHTFCATCILKWFFSRLHLACGGWHEPVDCPICRTHLVLTPERPPRPDATFPFVPNRIASSILESLLQKLARPAIAPIIKKEDIDGSWTSMSVQTCAADCVRVTPKPKDDVGSTDIILWREGGCLRAEWLKKERDGRREMNNLLQRWEHIQPDDFIELKHKFGV